MQNDRMAWFRGGDAECSVPPPKRRHPHRLVLLGPPGVGKGTQAELLCKVLKTCHLSTGDVFRAAAGQADPNPALAWALDAMKRGELVSDDLVVGVVAERTRCLQCWGGFLLDGFPRTASQAVALDTILHEHDLSLDAVVHYDLSIDELVGRLSGRRTCRQCKAIYHVQARPPRVEGTCDACGGGLVQRADDQPAAIRVRMEIYETETKPLIHYYATTGRLLTVPADGATEAVLDQTLQALDRKRQTVTL